jgi:hypothetical protein
MSTPTSNRSDSPKSLWNRLKGLLIGDAPEDVAVCEFDCRKNQCTYGEWATCERRIKLTALCKHDSVQSAQVAAGNVASKSAPDPVQS